MKRRELMFNRITAATAIVSVIITLGVLIASSIQFKRSLELSQAQLNLSKTERLELLQSGQPILGVSSGGFTPIKHDRTVEIDYLVHLQNFGVRPAINLKCKQYAFVMSRSDKTATPIDIFEVK